MSTPQNRCAGAPVAQAPRARSGSSVPGADASRCCSCATIVRASWTSEMSTAPGAACAIAQLFDAYVRHSAIVRVEQLRLGAEQLEHPLVYRVRDQETVHLNGMHLAHSMCAGHGLGLSGRFDLWLAQDHHRRCLDVQA